MRAFFVGSIIAKARDRSVQSSFPPAFRSAFSRPADALAFPDGASRAFVENWLLVSPEQPPSPAGAEGSHVRRRRTWHVETRHPESPGSFSHFHITIFMGTLAIFMGPPPSKSPSFRQRGGGHCFRSKTARGRSKRHANIKNPHPVPAKRSGTTVGQPRHLLIRRTAVFLRGRLLSISGHELLADERLIRGRR